MAARTNDAAGGPDRTRLFVCNGGFLRDRRLRRILDLSGYDLRIGLPGPGDLVGVWGNSPTAWRGETLARKRAVGLMRAEDAFLRSIRPGRSGEAPVGLLLDRSGAHYDAARPSDLERILTTAPLDDTALLNRARDAMARLRDSHLSKYNDFDPEADGPEPGYVLVVDQTRDDASVRASGGNDALFREMLVFAQEEHPGARVLIKTHPETEAGFRQGYYSDRDATGRVRLLRDAISPWTLLDGAVGVYTVSSHLGFEAILAGHRPRVFGQPFYAGWRLSHDQTPVPRRERRLTRAQLFAAAMFLYPRWYDPFRDHLCELETVLDNLEAWTRAFRQDRNGWVARDISLWKRRRIQQMFGRQEKVLFSQETTRQSKRRTITWAGRPDSAGASARIEDGFLRSRGLGAELTPPCSLVLDDLGIHFDPSRPSRLERLIAERKTLRNDQRDRAERLVADLIAARLSKYNQGGACPDIPEGHRILVTGQVEDDASVLSGAGRLCTNLALLRAARTAHPDAVIVYKPHPDVEAGLRPGAIDADLADVVAIQADPVALLNAIDEVWTLTSLLGFEALLRGLPVTTLGTPFYAGWGLTNDLGKVPERRSGVRPERAGLVHAALIDYPRYFDPTTGQICPVEVIVRRLADGRLPQGGPVNRVLSKLQGLFAGQAHLWR
ncbi:capsular polysaccharide biosynthesis protein [Sedimentitalea sp. JM2-8]|uniref:Capsular polysaccharide biosynthesis protein n=1 Tax=Sedimentitalea xiamensis TaxID=3050037 RepID=A0ABT7FJ85_9RHOB|nr:capsular polysaccharide biosynthesis protein [Sedimentitalea xiamensis]MDK3075203.1 capsular polysaccharide biosynthesis protein [Sedimentitalea xiamensis]